MKVIRYSITGMTDVYNPETVAVEKQEVLCTVTLPWSEENEERAKAEAHNGEYTVEDDGQPEAEAQPTQEERIAELEAALDLLLSGVTE